MRGDVFVREAAWRINLQDKSVRLVVKDSRVRNQQGQKIANSSLPSCRDLLPARRQSCESRPGRLQTLIKIILFPMYQAKLLRVNPVRSDRIRSNSAKWRNRRRQLSTLGLGEAVTLMYRAVEDRAAVSHVKLQQVEMQIEEDCAWQLLFLCHQHLSHCHERNYPPPPAAHADALCFHYPQSSRCAGPVLFHGCLRSFALIHFRRLPLFWL